MRRVALLSTGPVGEAAWQLLAALSDVSPVRAAHDDYALPSVDVLWVHTETEPPPLPADLLMPWVERGGRLLLTQRAAARVVGLGLEADGPNDTIVRTWRHQDDELVFSEFRKFGAFPHVRGLAGFGPQDRKSVV